MIYADFFNALRVLTTLRICPVSEWDMPSAYIYQIKAYLFTDWNVMQTNGKYILQLRV